MNVAAARGGPLPIGATRCGSEPLRATNATTTPSPTSAADQGAGKTAIVNAWWHPVEAEAGWVLSTLVATVFPCDASTECSGGGAEDWDHSQLQ